MKNSLLMLGMLAGFGASAQNKDIQDIQDLIQNKKIKDRIETEKPAILSPRFSHPLYSKQTPYVLPNGDRVVDGAVDGMPIVQPAMKNFTAMPRVNPNYPLPKTMPNGGRLFLDLGVAGPNHIMDQLAPSPILDKLLKNSGK